MRRRPNGMVRVVASCARCGGRPDVYPFRLEHGLAGHELAVCRECDGMPAGDATFLERAAMGLDPANAIDTMEFVERYVADPARLRRTARYFLGDDRYEELLPECRASIEAARERRAAFAGGWDDELEDDGDDYDDDGMGWGREHDDD